VVGLFHQKKDKENQAPLINRLGNVQRMLKNKQRKRGRVQKPPN